jgi:hypothetical protein
MRAVKALRAVPSLRDIARFTRWVERAEDEHVFWKGGRSSFSFKGVDMMPRRMAWRIYKGPIPADHYVHVVCGVKDCINPEHAELMPSDNSILRKKTYGWLAPNVCPKGHLVEGKNVLMQQGHTKRGVVMRPRCRECYHQLQNEWCRKRRASA